MLVAELHAFVRRRHADAGDLAHKRGLVLQPPAEWQVKLTALDIKAIRSAAIAHVGFLVLRAVRRDLLIDIYSEAIRKDGEIGVNAELLQSKGLLTRRVRRGIATPICSQIAADAQSIGNF